MSRPGLTVVLPIILIGITGTAVTVTNRNGDPQFSVAQQNLATLRPAALERFVASAPDPRPGMGRQRGRRARCSTQALGELRNPWVCTVKYPLGPEVRYRVTVDPAGRLQGSSSNGSLVVYGCCVGFRPLQ